MFIFNKITVKPQLPKRINRLEEIANNVWWSWNTEFLRLFKQIDRDLWEKQEKNPVKFLKLVSQEQLEKAANNNEFLRQYDKIVDNFLSSSSVIIFPVGLLGKLIRMAFVFFVIATSNRSKSI